MATLNQWVTEKLATSEKRLKVTGYTPEQFLLIEAKNSYTFTVAVLGIKGIIQITDVQPLFAGSNKPQLVVNVPSNTLWSGEAIDFVHSQHAAFGTVGDIARAAGTNDAGTFRNKNMDFFINAMKQHRNVLSVSYLCESVFEVERLRGDSCAVAVIDAYNMSAEDVRNARTRVGHFDVVVKSSSYGSVTTHAESAADSMDAKALIFKDLMVFLAR